VHAGLLDLHFHGVDDPVVLDHALRLGAIALQQGLHGQPQGRLRLTGHGEEADLDIVQLVMEMAVHVNAHPNLPVMYASVRSFAGAVKSRSVSPNSISSPRSKKAVRSLTRAACCMLWVTITIV